MGFDQHNVLYNSSDTEVLFKTQGNKAFLTFGSGNITDLNLNLPATSGNFVLLLKQDGTGSRTVTNYKAFDSAGNAASGSATVKFAGGSSPTLTTDANHVDIISLFWDADNSDTQKLYKRYYIDNLKELLHLNHIQFEHKQNLFFDWLLEKLDHPLAVLKLFPLSPNQRTFLILLRQK